MKVHDVMTRQVATCKPETNLAEAIAAMWEKNCGVLPVVGEDGAVLGVVTDRDIGVALGTRNVRSSDVLVRDVVQDHVLTCKSSDDIHVALQTMRQGHVRRLPVIAEQGRVEGIVSIDDVVINAEPDAKMGTAISYADVVGTLQEICGSSERLRRKSAA